MKKRKKSDEKRSFSAKVCDCLEISADILSDIPRFTINDNTEIQVENYKGILEYEENLVRLMAKNYEIKISGSSLVIMCITDEQVLIRGKIDSLSYIY